MFESEITHREGLGIIHVTPEYMLTPGPKGVLLRSMPVHGDSFVIFSWGDPKLKQDCQSRKDIIRANRQNIIYTCSRCIYAIQYMSSIQIYTLMYVYDVYMM